jgi:hypothetical protein
LTPFRKASSRQLWIPRGRPAKPWQGDRVDRDEQLFAFLDDLEHQARSLYDAERAGELADRNRSAYAEVTLASRLMASLDHEVTLALLGASPVRGRLRRVGPDWCLLRAPAQDWVVRLAAVRAVEGASTRSLPEVAWSPVDRLGLGSALRRLSDAATPCRLHGLDGVVTDGVLGRVGSDFVEVTSGAGRVLLVARDALAAVQSRPD